MLFRFIPPVWARDELGLKPREKKCTFEEALDLNAEGNNVYFFPNYPSESAYEAIPLNEFGRKRPVKGSDMDTFEYCFVDLDMKDYKTDNQDRSHNYETKDQFINVLYELSSINLMPTRIVDSGNGVHAYWRILDLDPMSFLRINRRLCRFLHTDPAVSTLNQLMRVPGTINVKNKEDYKVAEVIFEDQEVTYTAEQMHKGLPPITNDDEKYCIEHYNKAHSLVDHSINVSDKLPKSFFKLCKENSEVNALFYDTQQDRSSADFRLGHLLFNSGITKEDAMTVLFNTNKAAQRTNEHRYNYALNIIEKVWDEEAENTPKPTKKKMYQTVAEIIASGEGEQGERFYGHPGIDATENGFRLGHVMGVVGGFGNGKTSTSFNIQSWFVEFNANKDYVHLNIPLEQPKSELVAIWQNLVKILKSQRPDIDWDSRMYIVDNYNEDGTNRNLGIDDIEQIILDIEAETGKKVGSVNIDHGGILKQKKGSKDSEMDGLIGVYKSMKAMAVKTKVFLIMQSQTSRAKNMGGDVELDMDAAFGTSAFESYCDFILVLWQPLRRILDRAPDMTITAWKMPKIRKRHAILDKIKPDSVYAWKFDPYNATLRNMTQDEYKSFEFWNEHAIKARNKDRKRETTPLRVIDWIPFPTLAEKKSS